MIENRHNVVRPFCTRVPGVQIRFSRGGGQRQNAGGSGGEEEREAPGNEARSLDQNKNKQKYLAHAGKGRFDTGKRRREAIKADR